MVPLCYEKVNKQDSHIINIQAHWMYHHEHCNNDLSLSIIETGNNVRRPYLMYKKRILEILILKVIFVSRSKFSSTLKTLFRY